MKQLILVRGIPGSTKSTLAKKLSEKLKICNTYSTDDYWMRPDGIYDFNHKLLGQSHRWNQSRVKFNMADYLYAELTPLGPQYDNFIIIDNTNITFYEMKPYLAMALEYDYEVRFVEPDTEWKYDVQECYKRNKHGVPLATIQKMLDRFEGNFEVMQKFEEMKAAKHV